MEVGWSELTAPAEPDNSETIEKVLAWRRGKKGGMLSIHMEMCDKYICFFSLMKNIIVLKEIQNSFLKH